MIPRQKLQREFERYARSCGHARSWATKQANLRTDRELYSELPWLRRALLKIRHGLRLTAEKIQSTIGLRNGRGQREAGDPITATRNERQREAGRRTRGSPARGRGDQTAR